MSGICFLVVNLLQAFATIPVDDNGLPFIYIAFLHQHHDWDIPFLFLDLNAHESTLDPDQTNQGLDYYYQLAYCLVIVHHNQSRTDPPQPW
jgi:hypothetical protein